MKYKGGRRFLDYALSHEWFRMTFSHAVGLCFPLGGRRLIVEVSDDDGASWRRVRGMEAAKTGQLIRALDPDQLFHTSLSAYANIPYGRVVGDGAWGLDENWRREGQCVIDAYATLEEAVA